MIDLTAEHAEAAGGASTPGQQGGQGGRALPELPVSGKYPPKVIPQDAFQIALELALELEEPGGGRP